MCTRLVCVFIFRNIIFLGQFRWPWVNTAFEYCMVNVGYFWAEIFLELISALTYLKWYEPRVNVLHVSYEDHLGRSLPQAMTQKYHGLNILICNMNDVYFMELFPNEVIYPLKYFVEWIKIAWFCKILAGLVKQIYSFP